MAQDYRVTTPEAVVITYDVAGIATRCLAQLIDLFFIACWGAALLIAGVLLASNGRLAQDVAVILILTGGFLLVWGYFIVFETIWQGQTPGKRTLKIRVLKTSGYPITVVDAVIRNLVRFADLLPGFYGVGLITMFFSPQARRLGDYAAGTVVVRERSAVRLSDMAPVSPPKSPDIAAPLALGAVDPEEVGWDLRALTPRHSQLIDSFLERAPTLQDAARLRLGDEIATRVADQVGARHPLNAVRFLERIAYLLSVER